MEKIEIKSLEKNKVYEGFLLIRSIEQKLSKANSTYYQIIFSDGNLDLVGNYFSELEKFKEFIGKIVKVKIRTQIYNEKFSCIINEIKFEEISNDIKESFFEYSSNKEIHENYKEKLKDYIRQIEDKNLKKVCEYVFLEKYFDKFTTYPASKTFHHNKFGGLLEHSLNLLQTALFITDLYSYDHKFNKDLIIAGALFQDIGKVFEFNVDSLFHATYSKLGTLKGHITIGNEILEEALYMLNIPKNTDKMIHLSHIILSHHSLLEYGSPVFPSTPEAILISRVDQVDANIKTCVMAVKSTSPQNDFSQKIFPLSNVNLLLPTSEIIDEEKNYSKDTESPKEEGINGGLF